MTDFKYPGYTPMTDSDLYKAYYDAGEWRDGRRAIEQAVLSRLPKPDAEPVATSCADHSAGEIGYVKFHKRVPHGAKLYAHPPKPDTAEREPIAWLCKTEFGNGVSYSEKFWELHPDFYQGAQEKRPTAERDALVARIDYWLEGKDFEYEHDTQLMCDIRANLVGGGE